MGSEGGEERERAERQIYIFDSGGRNITIMVFQFFLLAKRLSLRTFFFTDDVVDELADVSIEAETADELLSNLVSAFEENSAPQSPKNNPVQCQVVDLAVDDFVVVSFSMEEQKKKSRRFVGRVLNIQNEELTIKFLTLKSTQNDSGYVYTYPKIDDIVNVKEDQIVKKLSPPEINRRGALKFDIHVKDL